MEGWWCLRFGNALASVEAPSAPRRSLELHRMGGWTDDTGNLVVFIQGDYPVALVPLDPVEAVPRVYAPQ